jgi:hypothetical protein
MISTDLANTADWIAGHVRRNEPVPVHAAACLAQQLMDLSARAQQLEIAPLRLNSPEVALGFGKRDDRDLNR